MTDAAVGRRQNANRNRRHQSYLRASFEAAKICREDAQATLIRWELDGKGPPVTRIGRDVYYEESNLEKWVRSQAEAAA